MAENPATLVDLTSEIVGAFVGNNSIPLADLPALISTVHRALQTAAEPEAKVPAPTKLTAAQIRKSITPDALISFEDGRRYKVLKRHLTARGMSLAAYRTKWGLPPNYPGTAPSYSAMRSGMAKTTGLGQVQGGREVPPAAVPKPQRKSGVEAPATASPRRRRKQATAKTI